MQNAGIDFMHSVVLGEALVVFNFPNPMSIFS